MTLRSLTVKERILIHLFDYHRFSEEYEAPVEVTQSGISRAVGIRVHHVTQYVKPLLADELIVERVRHINAKPRRRKVYFLTAKGRHQAASLRQSILTRVVPFNRKTGGLEEVPVSKLYLEERRGTTLLALLAELDALGHIPEVTGEPEPSLVEFTQEAPLVERFFGRNEELERVIHALRETPVVVVTGIAGIGKSALGSKVCEGFRGKRSLFWRRIRPWDTSMDLAARLASFLRAIGKLGLHAYLSRSGPKELSRVEELIAADLAGAVALLIFDDVHTASADGETFLSILQGALRRLDGCSALFISRTVPEFYARREVELDSSVVEFSLGTLDSESCHALLRDAGITGDQAKVLFELSGGSPLFLQVLAQSGPQADAATGASRLEAHIAEEIEPTLSEEERRCLQVASLYEVPVPKQALLLEEGGGTGTLLGLQRKGLLERSSMDRWTAHDLLRAYFQEGLPLKRKTSLVEQVVPWLMKQSKSSASSGELQTAIAYAENAVLIEVNRERRLSNLEQLGDLRASFGDFRGSIQAYRSVIDEAEGPEAQARLHRKTAHSLLPLMKREEADHELEEGLSLLPSGRSLERTWLLLGKGLLAEKGGDFDEAWSVVERVKEWAPAYPQEYRLQSWLGELEGRLFLSDPAKKDPARALRAFRRGMKDAEAGGLMTNVGWGYFHMNKAAAKMGKVDEALSYIDSAVLLADESGDLTLRQAALNDKAWRLAENQGDYEAAGELYQETFALAKEGQFVWLFLDHYKDFANLYERQRRYVEARESLEYFVTRAEMGPEYGTDSKIDDVAWLVRLSVLSEDRGGARRWLEEAIDLATDSASAGATHAIAWAQAMLEVDSENVESAEESFRIAMDKVSSAPPRYGRRTRGEFLLEYGRFLVSTGKGERARKILLEAIDHLSRQSLKPLEQAAREELQSLDSLPPEG